MDEEIVVVDTDGYPYRLTESTVGWFEFPDEIAICFRKDGQLLDVVRAPGGLRGRPAGTERLTAAEVSRVLRGGLKYASIDGGAAETVGELWQLVEKMA